MITEHRLILGDLLARGNSDAKGRPAAHERVTRVLPEVQLEVATAARQWREQIGLEGMALPEPGTAARKWRERLAQQNAIAATAPAPRATPAWRAWLPRWNAAAPVTPETRRQHGEAEQRRHGNGRVPPELDGDSAVLDACRLLRLNLPGGKQRMAPLVLIAPDAERQCGLIAAGLALALAEDGQRTLLVDADMRAPSFHSLFGFPPRPGLAEMLASGAARSLPVAPIADRLWLLPAGNTRPMPVLHRMPTLGMVAKELAQQFDMVIYHIGGLYRPAEALQLSIHVGSAVFTLRAGIDTAEPVRRMHGTLERAGVSVLGFALVGGDA